MDHVDSYRQLSREELVRRLRALESGPEGTRGQHVDAALSDSEERLRAIVDTAVEGIITIDERGIIESMNPAAERIFGSPGNTWIGQNVSALMPTPYRHEHDGYIANYRRTGEAKIIGVGREVVGQRSDGTIFPMDLSVTEVRLAGRRMFTGIVRDITERKQLEKEILEASDRERRRIGQDLHDGLCQQLAGIELVCQTLEEDLEEEVPQRAAQAREIAGHVRDAIAQARGLARGLSPVDVDAGGLSHALRELAATTEKLFKARCSVTCEEGVGIADNGVATHLYRIAQEAIQNAIRHGRATEIQIALERLDRGVRLSVVDNGSGISSGVKEASGMGLRIMRFRAGVIGGTLDIRGAEGRGTVVSCLVLKSQCTPCTPYAPDAPDAIHE